MIRATTFPASTKKPEKIQRQSNANLTIAQCFRETIRYQQGAAGEILRTSEPHVTGRTIMRNNASNGLVSCLIDAYNDHNNVVLRPEDFWIAVLTQFSLYVTANAEELRDTFVDFQGQRELTIFGLGGIRTADFAGMSVSMTEQIAKNLKDASIRDWILPSFTTTTANDRVVCSIVMMSSMQKYFSYKFCLCCGIANVTLLGTPEDYVALRNKVDRLATFPALKKWHALLMPIFDELVNASQGKHSVEFWSKVCSNHGGGSGPSYVSGWVTAFCCFNEKGEWQGDRTTIESVFDGKKTASAYPFIDDNDIPPGIVSVPVTVDDNGTEYKTKMFAGSMVQEQVDSMTLAPRLDWCIALIDQAVVDAAATQSQW